MKANKNKSDKSEQQTPVVKPQTTDDGQTAVRETANGETRAPFDFLWLLSCVAVTAVAVFLRFYRLDLKPLHHDEGVNGFFLTTLFREGVYKYDPSNYHGPTLYYAALAFSKAFGLETVSIRASVAIFGVLTVVLAFFLKRYIGKTGALAAALFLALSPGMVFISRYFIHEILFVFFSFALAVAILYFIEKEKAGAFAVAAMTLLLLVCFLPTALNLASALGDGESLIWILRLFFFALEAVLIFLLMRMLLAWNGGRAIYLLLASASLALLFATKETAFITIGTMIIAAICVLVWRKIRRAAEDDDQLENVPPTWANFRAALGNSTDAWLLIFGCVLIFAYVGVLFFSSFFTYGEGVSKAFEAYDFWTKTGSKDHTQNGFLAYLKWGIKLESAIFLLSAIGGVIALAKGRHRFAIFAAFWSFGMFAAYTIIPYKTPWLALSFLLPMCVAAGYGVGELARARHTGLKIAGYGLAAAACLGLGYQTYDLNFVRYDDNSLPYIYAHTERGFLDLIKEIERYAEKSGKGREAQIDVVSPDYWSMPWYLRDYKKAFFHGQLIAANTSEMLVAGESQAAELQSRYAAHYKYAGTFPLRPGVKLYLLVRRDLADASAKEIYRIGETER